MATRLTFVDGSAQASFDAIGLVRYEDFIGFEAGAIVGESGTTQTRRFAIASASAGNVLYLKKYRYRGVRRRHRFRVDKAALEARNYSTLRRRCGVAAPEVVVHGSRRHGWRLLDAIIVTREVAQAVSMEDLFERRWPRADRAVGDPARAALLDEAARVVGRMHRTGFYHIDLQWRNLLVSRVDSAGVSICVCDSPRGGLRRWRPHRMHGALRDLSSLHKEARRRMTRTEQMRWLNDYLRASGLRADRRVLVWTIILDRVIKDHGVWH